MMKRKRELVQIAEAEGVTDITVTQTGNGLRVSGLHNGRSVGAVAPVSTKAARVTTNFRGDIRRQIRAAQ